MLIDWTFAGHDGRRPLCLWPQSYRGHNMKISRPMQAAATVRAVSPKIQRGPALLLIAPHLSSAAPCLSARPALLAPSVDRSTNGGASRIARSEGFSQALICQLEMVKLQVWLGRSDSFDCSLQTSQLHGIAPKSSRAKRQIGENTEDTPAAVGSLGGAQYVRQFGD
jgi:hypothetical protein